MKALVIACAVLGVGLLLALWRADSLGTRAQAAEDQVTELNAALESRRNTQQLLAQLDTEHTEALANAQKTNDQLRTAVATGERRLSVLAKCPAARGPAASTSLDDAEARAELDPAAAERIVRIANDGDDAIRALAGLQDYVRNVCLKSQ